MINIDLISVETGLSGFQIGIFRVRYPPCGIELVVRNSKVASPSAPTISELLVIEQEASGPGVALKKNVGSISSLRTVLSGFLKTAVNNDVFDVRVGLLMFSIVNVKND